MSKRDNSGTFSRNKDKQDGDNKPHIKGQCTINGVDYWLDGWLKDGANGTFYSVAFKEKEQRRDARSAQKASQKMQQPDFDDSVPF